MSVAENSRDDAETVDQFGRNITKKRNYDDAINSNDIGFKSKSGSRFSDSNEFPRDRDVGHRDFGRGAGGANDWHGGNEGPSRGGDRGGGYPHRNQYPPRGGGREGGFYHDRPPAGMPTGFPSQSSGRRSFDRAPSPPRGVGGRDRYDDGDRYGGPPNRPPGYPPSGSGGSMSLAPPLPSGNSNSSSGHPNKAPQFAAPMKSFRSFVQTLSDDMSPEMYQRRYDDYQYAYVKDFSDAFFHANKSEEWFRDRYDPSRISEQEHSTAEWGASECQVFKTSILENPSLFVSSVSLAPPTGEQLKAVDEKSVDGNRVVKSETHIPGHEDRTLFLQGIPDRCTKSQLKAAIISAFVNPSKNKYNSPHSGPAPPSVPPKSSPIVAPQRIVMAQPSWQPKDVPSFERCAWVVMPTVESTAEALKCLRNIVLVIRAPDEITTPATPMNRNDIIMEFTLQVTLRVIRPPKASLPNFLSEIPRVRVDIYNATNLASLLDEDRNIPEESRLSSIFRIPEVEEAVSGRLTDRLDVCVAYLRRVHFVAFYGGRRFRDEAHLLMGFPGVLHRSLHTADSVKPTGASSIAVTEGEQPASDDSRGQEEDTSKDAVEVGDDEDDEEEDLDPDSRRSKLIVTAEALGEGEIAELTAGSDQVANSSSTRDFLASSSSTTLITSPSEFLGPNWPYSYPRADTKIVEMIRDLTNKRRAAATAAAAAEKAALDAAEKAAQEASEKVDAESAISDLGKSAAVVGTEQKPAPPSVTSNLPLFNHNKLNRDEEDAKEIVRLQEKVYEEAVKASAKIEVEGKARCRYLNCQKLFKNLDFLAKHMRSKHEHFAMEALVKVAEPYMRTRYDAEDINARPLPPVMVESQNGFDIKPIREILERIRNNGVGTQGLSVIPMGAPQMMNMVFNQQGMGTGQGFNHRGGGRGGFHDGNMQGRGGFGGRGGSGDFQANRGRGRESDGPTDEPRNSFKRGRDSDGGDNSYRQGNPRSSTGSIKSFEEGTTNDSIATSGDAADSSGGMKRKSNYVDFDAPKESSIVNIEYGVAALPPVKRRRLIARKSM